MRVVDCDCGTIVQAANDDELVDRLREHFAEDHPDTDRGDAALRRLVAERAYTATDS